MVTTRYHKCQPHNSTGARERFSSGGGGKSVDMPSDCQILGGHRHIHTGFVGGMFFTLNLGC